MSLDALAPAFLSGDIKESPSLQDDDAKDLPSATESFIDSREGDEALKLVGKERQVQFSEEYNLKLRKKLVSIQNYILSAYADFSLIPGPMDPAAVCSGVLHSIPGQNLVKLC